MSSACSDARGFVYCVSLVGVTGVRTEISDDVASFLDRVRNYSNVPLAVGFGISRGDQVKAMSQFADAVVVGSALLEVVGKTSRDQLSREVRKFMNGLNIG